jgi:hypothetical protein
VHIFHPSLSFLAEAQPRHDNRRGQIALFGRGAHFLGDRTNYKAVFVVNLLNRPTNGTRVSVRKRVTFGPIVST